MCLSLAPDIAEAFQNMSFFQSGQLKSTPSIKRTGSSKYLREGLCRLKHCRFVSFRFVFVVFCSVVLCFVFVHYRHEHR